MSSLGRETSLGEKNSEFEAQQIYIYTHTYIYIYIYIYIYGVARGIMVIFVENGLSDPSSNSGGGCLLLTSR